MPTAMPPSAAIATALRWRAVAPTRHRSRHWRHARAPGAGRDTLIQIKRTRTTPCPTAPPSDGGDRRPLGGPFRSLSRDERSAVPASPSAPRRARVAAPTARARAVRGVLRGPHDRRARGGHLPPARRRGVGGGRHEGLGARARARPLGDVAARPDAAELRRVAHRLDARRPHAAGPQPGEARRPREPALRRARRAARG